MKTAHLLTIYKIILVVILAAVICMLTGCANTESLSALLDRLEFEDGDKGCVDLRTSVDLNPLPVFTSNATLIYKKNTGEDSPQC